MLFSNELPHRKQRGIKLLFTIILSRGTGYSPEGSSSVKVRVIRGKNKK